MTLSQNQQLEDHFRAHAGEWLEASEIATAFKISKVALADRVAHLRRAREMQIQTTLGSATEDDVHVHFYRYRFIPKNATETQLNLPAAQRGAVQQDLIQIFERDGSPAR